MPCYRILCPLLGCRHEFTMDSVSNGAIISSLPQPTCKVERYFSIQLLDWQAIPSFFDIILDESTHIYLMKNGQRSRLISLVLKRNEIYDSSCWLCPQGRDFASVQDLVIKNLLDLVPKCKRRPCMTSRDQRRSPYWEETFAPVQNFGVNLWFETSTTVVGNWKSSKPGKGTCNNVNLLAFMQ